jgi:hypothetical protein
MPLPNAVVWKVYRSKTHLLELQTEIERYFETNPGRVIRVEDGNPDEYTGIFQASGPIPGRLPIIMGDCLQNLRSALDYLVWELVLAANEVPGRHNMFPICSTLRAFENQLEKKRLAGLKPEAVAEMRTLQPYNHGKDFEKTLLWILDDLCNINKHRRVLTTDLYGGPSDLEWSPKDGQILAKVDLASIRKGAKIGPFPIVDGPKGPGIRIDADPKIAVIIAVDEGPARGMDIGLILTELLKYVEFGVLPKFQRFFE